VDGSLIHDGRDAERPNECHAVAVHEQHQRDRRYGQGRPPHVTEDEGRHQEDDRAEAQDDRQRGNQLVERQLSDVLPVQEQDGICGDEERIERPGSGAYGGSKTTETQATSFRGSRPARRPARPWYRRRQMIGA
jgi:hypothetical protein